MKTPHPPIAIAPGSKEEWIVREVMRRLQALSQAPGATPRAAPAMPEASAAGAPHTATLSGMVVALAAIQGLPNGVRRVRIGRRAVVTPAAAEWLRERSIELERTDTPRSANGSWALVSDAPGRTSQRAKEAIERVVGPVAYHVDSCPDALSRQVAGQVQEGRRCVWLSDRPAVALCRANRQSGVRAAWALDLPTLQTAVDQLNANVWITEPGRHTSAQWTQLLQIASSV